MNNPVTLKPFRFETSVITARRPDGAPGAWRELGRPADLVSALALLAGHLGVEVPTLHAELYLGTYDVTDASGLVVGWVKMDSDTVLPEGPAWTKLLDGSAY
jgi:hypothetical protein